MKNISSTTENFIREQVALKFKKQLNALKKKKTALDGKWHDISQQIYDLTEQMDNVGGMSDRQFNEVEKLEEDLTDIVRKSCAKTIADRLKQIGLKMKDEKKTIECILDCSGLFDAINDKYIINVSNNADEIKKRRQELTDRRGKICEECGTASAEINELNRKIDAHVRSIVVKLELGGNYDGLMTMINEIKA